MRIRSIGSKLTIWYTGLLSLTFLLLATIAYGLLTYSLSRDMDYALHGIAEVMAEKARDEGSAFYPADVDELFRRFFGFSPLERHFEIFDPRQQRGGGRPEPQSPNVPVSPEALERAARGDSHFETVHSTGPYPVRVLTVPVIESGRVINLVRVGMSLENMYKTRRRFLMSMAAVFPLGFLLSGGGGWLLARRALSPVDRMTQTARKISGERLDQRLQESGTGDELDRLAKTLNDMLGRLHDAFDQMRRFSADASHELQTPLTILKGEMEVALRQQRSPEEYQDVLTSGLEEIARINHLVEGLLLLARADAGMLQLDLQTVELKDCILELFAQMKPVAGARGVHLQVRTLEPLTVQGDREHLRRLLLNLVDNAIKYTPEGGSVTLSLQAENGWARVAISDTGIGFSGEEQAQLFNRFHRSTEARSRDSKGVGLGLSIVHSIVQAHGGRIQVKGRPNRGSTFTVDLPAPPTEFS